MMTTCPRHDLELYAYGFLSTEEEAVVASHLVSCEACRADAAALGRECELVAFELSLDPGTARAAVAAPRIIRPRIATAGALAAMLLIAFVLHAVFGPDAPPPEVASIDAGGEEREAAEEPTPAGQIVLLLPIDPDPELRRRVEELTARLREQEEAARPPDRPPLTPEREVEEHDWGALAESLLEAAPDLRAGRIPADPDRLGRYLDALVALRRLAERADVPSTPGGTLRDPRTGPKLLGAVIRKTWPDAPEPVVARAEQQARDAIDEYVARVETATTPEEKADAEEALRADLAEEVDRVEETEGPPPVKEVATDRNLVPDTRSTADRLLDSMGLLVTGDRVLRGTGAEVVKLVVAGFREELGSTAPDESLLRAIAEDWVRGCSALESRAPDEVVAAFRASLEGRPADDARVSRLRGALLDVQADAEAALARLVGTGAAGRALAVPTFFVLAP